jgi:hypothetical protein
VSTGVEQGLQSDMAACSRMSMACWRWWRKKPLGSALGGDAKEVVKGPQVLRRELPLKGDDRAL